MWVRSSQNKDNMAGRLLQGLKQSVEGLRSQHVHFVDNIYLITAVNRRKGQLIPQGFNLVNTTIGGSVDFKNIHGAALGNAATIIALTAGVRSGPMLAVQRLG